MAKLVHLGDRKEPWRASQFSPFAAFDAVWTLKKQVAELQEAMASLIKRVNGCEDCE